jgi:hypothetical protein
MACAGAITRVWGFRKIDNLEGAVNTYAGYFFLNKNDDL